jgi:hypothetical protein
MLRKKTDGNPYSWAIVWGPGGPHGIIGVFTTILYGNEFQNPQFFQQTISLFPEQSTLVYFLEFFDGFFKKQPRDVVLLTAARRH